MRKKLAIVATIILGILRMDATNSITVTTDSIEVGVAFITPSIVRVVKHPKDTPTPSKESFSVTAKPVDVDGKVRDSKKAMLLSSSELTVSVDKTTGCVSFVKNGKTLLQENGSPVFTPFNDAGVPSYRVRQGFALDKDEAIYGLGNLENGQLSQRGIHRQLLPGNIEDGIPVFVSVKGYGLFWDNYSPTTFSDNNPGLTYFESEVGDLIDYYFMSGNSIDGAVAQMRNLTGQVPMFPLWTYGFWQSRERYRSQDETVGVVKKYRELGVPIDGIIQDWQYWGNNYLWNAMEFMNPEFPNPHKMVKDIHDLNAHVIISIWSSFGPQTKAYKELKQKGLLFDISTWPQSGIAEQWPPRMDYPSGVKVYDAYSPEARAIYWKHLSAMDSIGLDGWWMDSTEPDHFDIKDSDYDMPTTLGSFRRVRNAYPLLTVGGVHDNQKLASKGTKRVFILTRSGYAGQQRYGCNIWTGDVTSSWHNLRKQIPAMLNFTMTGNPNANSDLGGFFCGAYNHNGPNSATRNPMFRELFVRWFQTGVCTPMMRCHGADIKREIYYFGEKGDVVYDAIADAIKLRYRLLPYIYSTSWNVTSKGASFMNPLAAKFPADKLVYDMGNEYMFGENILVAPILKSNYTPEVLAKSDENTGWDRSEHFDLMAESCDFTIPFTTSVYLPKGTSWWDFSTNACHRGGNRVEKTADLNTIPLYLKAGTILPLGPDVQYATEKPWDALEIRVYPGADGSFTLYEDEWDGYNYENGKYSTIAFRWNDKNKTLTIDSREGSYPNMLASRTFNVVLATPQGLKEPVSISYEGTQTSVKL